MFSQAPLWILPAAAGLACVISLVAMPLLIQICKKRQWVSPLDFRRKNGSQVPLLGGVGVFGAVVITVMLLGMENFYYSLLCALPIFIAGAFDDVFEFSARPKALIHILSTAAWLYLTPVDQLILTQAGCSPFWAIFLTGFWVMGIINAMNMIDGMDGEAAGFSLTVALLLAFIAGGSGLGLPLIAVAGACLGFLIFNWPPARIYLGDSGSTVLGFLLATSSAALEINGQALGSVFVPLFVFAFPEADAILSMYRRVKSKSSMFRGDHDHIHHKLRKLGLSVPQSLVIIYTATAYSGLAAYTMLALSDLPVKWLVLSLSTVGLLFLLGGVYYLEFRQAHQVSTVSQSMIHRYLKLTDQLVIDPNSFQATVYDLLPYYKELQMRGIAEVNDFVHGFAEYMSKEHPEAEYVLCGSYSVIAVEKLQALDETPLAGLSKKFYALLYEYSVVKSESAIPWGMSFYSSRSKGDHFIKKFGLETRMMEPLKSAG